MNKMQRLESLRARLVTVTPSVKLRYGYRYYGTKVFLKNKVGNAFGVFVMVLEKSNARILLKVIKFSVSNLIVINTPK